MYQYKHRIIIVHVPTRDIVIAIDFNRVGGQLMRVEAVCL